MGKNVVINAIAATKARMRRMSDCEIIEDTVSNNCIVGSTLVEVACASIFGVHSGSP